MQESPVNNARPTLSLFPKGGVSAGLTRRQWLRMSALTGLGLAGGRILAAATGEERHPATAKNCICIFLCGGPSQPDLWDIKLDAPVGIRSEFAPVQTSVPGTLFTELIPNVARHADQLALIRSMTHTNNDHNGAIVHSLLGQLPPC